MNKIDPTLNKYLIIVSANDEVALKRYVELLLEYLQSERGKNKYLTVGNFAYTLQVGREEFLFRFCFAAQTFEAIITTFNDYLEGRSGSNFFVGKSQVKVSQASLDNSDIDYNNSLSVEEIAQAWINGKKINWVGLYKSADMRRISLPTYPFDGKVYWFDESRKNTLSKNVVPLHPLIDKNNSTINKISFSKIFYPGEYFIHDHNIGGNAILPGAAYLEIAKCAAEYANERSMSMIKDVIWARPIQIEGKTKEIFTELVGQVGHIIFEIISIYEGKRIVHCKGKVVEKNEKLFSGESLDFSEIKRRCTSVQTQINLYQKFQTFGFNYGDGFKVIKVAYSNDSEALAEVQLPPHLYHSFSKYQLHISIVDAAFQAIMTIERPAADLDDRIYIPFGLGSLEVFSRLTHEGYVYVFLDNGKNLDDGIKKYQIFILDKAGRILVRLTDFTARAVRDVSVQKIKSPVLYFSQAWQPIKMTEKPKKPKDGSQLLIIYDGASPRKINVAPDVGILGSQVSFVSLADSYQEVGNNYQICANQLDDLRSLFRSLREKQLLPEYIFICSYTSNDMTAFVKCSPHFIAASRLSQCLKNLQQTYYEENYLSEVFCYLLVGSTDGVLPIEVCGIEGFAKSITSVNKKFKVAVIQIEKDFIKNNGFYSVLNKILQCNVSGGQCLEYRDNFFYAKQVKQLSLNINANQKLLPMFRDRGIYIITGGCGQLGIIIGEHLAKRYQAKMVLIGRSPYTGKIKSVISKIQSLGGDAKYYQADVGDFNQLERTIQLIRDDYKEINGIFHIAGVSIDKTLIYTTDQEFNRVMNAKVFGAIYLDEITRKDKMDFFILFSSISSIIGDFGACSYAMANAFLDSYVDIREKARLDVKCYGRTIGINWSIWANGGMHLPKEEAEHYVDYTGMLPLQDYDGIDVLEKLPHFDVSRLIVATGDVNKIKRIFNIKENDSGDFFTPMEKHSKLLKNSELQLQNNSMNNTILVKATEDYLKGILAKCIRLQESEIEVTVPLEKYGIDSMMILELNNILEQQFSSLPRTLFFEYTDLQSLANYFVQNHSAKLLEHLGGNLAKYQQDQSSELEAEKQANIKPKSFSIEDNVNHGVDIAVIGVSGRYPMARNINEFYENLKDGKDCIQEVPAERWDVHKIFDPTPNKLGKSVSKWGGFINDVDRFDATFFGIIPKVAKMIDPQERLFLETVWEAIEDAGYTPEQLTDKTQDYRKNDVGIFLGVMYDDYKLIETEEFLKGNYGAMTGYWNASLANRVSYTLNFRGPSVVVDTACSSSLMAVDLACEAIISGSCKLAIAGGVSLSIHPSKYLRLSFLGMASREGKCRAFGEGGSGYVPGEGVGAILLKPLHLAIADNDNIYAVIKGAVSNHGGRTNGFSVPNPNAQADVITQTLEKTKIDPRTISYIEAHGTGTELGDPIEITGLTKSYRRFTADKQFCAIGSVKSNIGHCEGAAGVAAVTKVILQLKYRKLFPSLHAKQLNKHIDFANSPFYVQQDLADWNLSNVSHLKKTAINVRRSGISSFGAGGANTHLIMEEYLAQQEDKSEDAFSNCNELILISAVNEDRLKEYILRWVDYLRKDVDSLALRDIAYTSQFGRIMQKARIAIVASNKQELLAKLQLVIKNYGANIDNVFYSNLSNDCAKEGKEVIGNLLGTRDLAKLAKLWVGGAMVEFSKLYNSKPRRVSIPTYPFQKDIFWIETTENIGQEISLTKSEDLKHDLSNIQSIPLIRREVNESSDLSKLLEMQMIDYLKSIIAEVTQLKKGEINEHREFAEFGIDSISLAGINNKILSDFPDFSPTSLLAYQTIYALVGYLVEAHYDLLKRKFATNEVVTVVEESARSTGATPVQVGENNMPGFSIEGTPYQKVARKLIKLLENITGLKNINPSQSYEKYNLSSLNIHEFVNCIKNEMPGVSDSILFAYQSIEELARYIVDNELYSESNNRVELMSPANHSNGDIAIIGLAGKYPGAADREELWNNLSKGLSAIREIPKSRWFSNSGLAKSIHCKWGALLDDIDLFDALFFNIAPKDAETIDPQERLFLEVVWHLLEDAGYLKSDPRLVNGNVGVFVGVTNANYNAIGIEELLAGNSVITKVSFASIANRVSNYFNFKGPSLPVDTMCSSSLTAVHLACEHIRSGECKIAIAGGVNVYSHPVGYLYLEQANLLSRDGKTRSFGKGGTGFVPGEGVGVVMLKSLAEAEKDNDHIYAVIKGSAINHYGHTNGYFVPHPLQQAELIKSAVKSAGIDPATINYVETQTVGSELNDTVEVEAIKQAFNELCANRPCLVMGSVKPNLGHAESASGILQLIKVILQLQHQTILPTIYEELNPNIRLNHEQFTIQYDLKPWERVKIVSGENSMVYPLRAGISSFGAGGAGAHIIVEEYINPAQMKVSALENCDKLFIFSTKSLQQLHELLKNYIGYFSSMKFDYQEMVNIAYTLQISRESFNYRAAIIAKNMLDLREKIVDLLAGKLSRSIFVTSEVYPKAQPERAAINIEKNLLQSPDLMYLAQAWVSGAEINWSDLYKDLFPRRVSLLGYPFERKYCWVTAKSKEISIIVPDAVSSRYEVLSEESKRQMESGLSGIHSMLCPICSMMVLSFLLENRFIENGGSIHRKRLLRKLSGYLSNSKVAKTWVAFLIQQQYLLVDDDFNLRCRLSEEVEAIVNNIVSRKDMLARAFPDFSPHLRLLTFCKDNYRTIMRSDFIAKDYLAIPQIGRDIESIYLAQNRLTKILKPMIASYVNQLLQCGITRQHRNLRVLDLGDGTFGVGSIIIETCSQQAQGVTYEICCKRNEINFARVLKNNFPVDNVQVYLSDCKYTELASSNCQYDFIILQLPKKDIVTADSYLSTAKELVSPNGMVIIYEPIEMDYLQLTFALLGIHELYSTSEINNTNRLSWDDLLVKYEFVKKDVLGDWLILLASSRPETNHTTQLNAIVKTVYEEELGIEESNFDANVDLKDYGLSSILHARIFSRLSQILPFAINPEQLLSCINFNQILTKLQQLSGDELNCGNKRQNKLGTLIDNNAPLTIGQSTYQLKKLTLNTGREISYYHFGKGDPLVFLTALAFSPSIWEHQIEYFAEHYAIILPVFPGHYGAEYVGEKITFKQLANDVIQILDNHKYKTAHIVGWCMAGNIAQLIGCYYPKNVRSLTLICTTPMDIRLKGLTKNDLAAYSEDPLGIYQLEFQNIYADNFINYAQPHIDLIKKGHCKVDANAMIYYLNELFQFNTLDQLGGLAMPTLVISGAWDISFPAEQVALLHKKIPASCYVNFEQSGHMPFVAEYAKFNRQLDDFLRNAVTIDIKDNIC